MKVFTRISSFVMALTLALLCVLTFPTEANAAAEATEGYYTYEVSNGEATITGCDESISGDITIPSTLGGYPVTAVGDWAFEFCTHLTSIDISDSVTSIGDYAFRDCYNLTNITIPSGVTCIGVYAFVYSDSLTDITVHADNEHYASENGVLFNKDKTLLVCYPDGKTENTYGIPDSVTGIGCGAFTGCRLTRIIIPDSVTSIGAGAFDSCYSLTSIDIPDSVTSIDDYAFCYCSSLTNITVHADNVNYASKNGVLFNKDKTLLVCYPDGKTENTYGIPDGVTGIGYGAFTGCRLTRIIIPDSVTSIGDDAFYDCARLISVIIGNGVTSIGDYAFSWCEELTSITIPDSVTSIGDQAFSACSSLTSVTIPDSVTNIGDDAFSLCDSLGTVIYCGDQAQWDAIDIGEYNEDLTEATLQFHNYQGGTCTLCGDTNGPVTIEKLKTPTLTRNGTALSWNAVEFADGYEVYRATKKSGKYTKVADITEPTWQDESAIASGKTYYYKVKAVYTEDTTKNSGFSSVVSVDYPCATPELTVETGSAGKPVLTWNKITGAKKYEIWRSVDGGTFKKLGTSTKLTYTDKKATAGAECTYKVKALGSKSAYNGEFSNTGSCYVTCAAPSVTLKLDSKTGKPALSWKKISGAVGYAIYRSDNDGEYELLTTVTAVSYKDTSAQMDNKYSYYVVTVGKSEVFNSIPSAVKSVTLTVKAPKLTGSADTEGKPVISWTAVENAVSYNIYRSTKSSKGYSLLATVETTSYTDTSVATGKTYYYKVAAVGANTESAMSSYLKQVGKCATPEISVELDGTSGKPVISWEKVDGAKKYTVYRATSENGKYKSIGTSKTNTYTDSKAVPGTEYYYKVVANGSKSSYNSNYSNVVSAVGYVAQPQITVKNDSKGKPVVSWKKISGAEKYIVAYVDVTDLEDESQLTEQFVLENLQYVEVSKKKTSVTLTDTETGRLYAVAVVAVPKNEEYFAISQIGYVAATCATPKATGKVGANKKPVISWKEVDGAAGYIVLRSTSKTKGYEAIAAIEEGTSFEDLTAVKGKTYYYKVIAVDYSGFESAESTYVKVKSK